MRMYVAGEWRTSGRTTQVVAPYTGETIDSVPSAGPEDVEAALVAAEDAAPAMAALPGHRRVEILRRAAELIEEQAEDIARTIALEVGKPLSEALPETVRSAELLRLSAFEGTQIRGETLPIDAHAGAAGKLGMTLRMPCGVVVAITPFNYPLLLVAHKVGPALATGNAVVLKPASATPLTALRLTEILLEAGLPPNGLQCITGSGTGVGRALCADDRVRKISFTGSSEVGRAISAVAGVKRMSLELGANCPMIVLPDGDLQAAAEAAAVGGYVNAGQVCISLQRAIVHRDVYADFIDATRSSVASINTGDPLDPSTRMGPMISPAEADRVSACIREATDLGARMIVGGERRGALIEPTIVADVDPHMRIFTDELFGPAISMSPVSTVDEAIALANRSQYGLAAGVFTQNLTLAVRFAREVQAGNVHINWTPLWRADFMPYGGLKGSGVGKEGPRYAAEEMTEVKTVVFHGLEA
jgi:acyl-CoA reductase-like NAD-dependent aldehyde dehydrogenase